MQAANKSAAQLMAELSDESSSGEEEEVVPPRLMLRDGPTEATGPTDPEFFMDPTSVWEHRVKNEAVLVMAQIGQAPAELHYRYCHRECRRQLLLQKRVLDEYEKPGMVQVMRVAMKLANNGSIPGPGEHSANHGRKSDFIRRCAAALKAINPEEETDTTKLSAEKQSIIRRIIGGDTSVPYDGCLSQGCLDKKTTWVAAKGLEGVSRCARCKLPKCYRRTVHSIHDVMHPLMNKMKLADRRGMFY